LHNNESEGIQKINHLNMAHLTQELELQKCPHCNVDTPSLKQQWGTVTTTHSGGNQRNWRVYKCTRCGGLVTAASNRTDSYVTEIYPTTSQVDDSIPEKARGYLDQALNSLHAPAGAVMLAASAVDSMLKAKNYAEGNLYNRINQAADDHVITKEMSRWAHQVRLDANDQRHADDEAALPTDQDAKKSIEFALALAEFIFVLPSRVTRGLEETKPSSQE